MVIMRVNWKVVGLVVVVLLLLFLVFVRRRENLESSGTCSSEQEEIDGKCYEKCRDGFAAKGTSCYEVCKEGEISEGMTCISADKETRTILSYTRGEILLPKAIASIPVDCEEGFTAIGTMCFEGCKEGYTRSGTYCSENCSNVAQDQGLYCASEDGKTVFKKTYLPKTVFSKHVNTSNLMACVDGYIRNEAACIQKCPDGHVLDGALCIEQCKEDETDMGTTCLKAQTFRNKNVMPVGISEVPVKT
jgi:hypothetical protein